MFIKLQWEILKMHITYRRTDNSVLIILPDIVINEDMLNLGVKRVNPDWFTS